MSLKAPIRKPRKSEIIGVGNDEIGFLYLEKRGYVTVGEREVIDEWEIKRQQGLTVIDKLIRKVAGDRFTATNDGEGKLAWVVRHKSTGAEVTPSNGKTSRAATQDGAKAIARSEAQALLFPQQIGDVEVVAEGDNILLEYPEEAEQLSMLNLPANKLKAIVATEFIKGRVAYPVELVETAVINSEELAIVPAPFYLKNKEGIKFNSCVVTIKGNHDLEAEKIKVDPISENLAPESIGYWYSPINKKIVVGSPDWTNKDTADLDERLVECIFEFYQNERSGWVEAQVGEQKTEPQETEEQTKALEQSNGKKSTSASKDTKSLIPA